jgi:uncharacterized protein (DUF111 family)
MHKPFIIEYEDVKKLAKENNQPPYLVYSKTSTNFLKS